jgi:GNAT superfamily N-acetyltransferase
VSSSQLLVTRPDGLTMSDDPTRIDLERVVEWLSRSYWAKSRGRGTIERSLRGSRTFGVYGAEGQVAFARAVTDAATFGWIADVIVEESHRGRGIGTWLVTAIVEQLRAEGVPRLVLATRDAHGVYERVGFSGLATPDSWMEIDERADRRRPGNA